MSSNAFAVPRYMYAANFFEGSISIYRVDAETGLPYHITHVPTLKSPSALILHPSGRFLYVVSQTVDQIAIYRVDAQSGMLLETPESPVSSRVRSTFRMDISPDGRYLYVPGRFTQDLAVFAINPQTGALSPHMEKNPATLGERGRFVTRTPDGRFVYVSNTFSDSIAAFRVDPDDGVLQPVEGMPFAAGDAPEGLMVHPNGKFLYVGNWRDGNISSYAIKGSSGQLMPLAGPAVETGHYPFAGMFHPSGHFLYLVNWASSDISSFAVDGASGALTPLRERRLQCGGDSPVNITLDVSGRFAYVPTYADSAMSVFRVNPDTGRLEDLKRIMTRPGVRQVALLEGDEAVSVVSRYLFVSDTKDSTIKSFALAGDAQAPSLIGKFSLGDAAQGLALSPNGKWLYFSNTKKRSIGALAISSKGHMTPLKDGEVVLAGEPLHIRANAQGNHLYVVTQNPNQFITYSIDAKSGHLTLLQQEQLYLPEESRPTQVVGTPEERLNYVLDGARGKVFGYRYLSADGPLTFELTQYGSPFDILPQATDMAISPNGLWAVVVSAEGKLASYALPGIWNPLVPHRQGELAPGGELVDVAVHPRGRWVYLLDAKGQRILTYRIDDNMGDLRPIAAEAKLAGKPRELLLDARGTSAYLRYDDKAGMTQFQVDPDTGRLTSPLEVLPELLPASAVFSYQIQ